MSELIENANSKGVRPDYTGIESKFWVKETVFGTSPLFDPKKALEVIRNDPTVKAAITTIVDKTLESGWRIQGRDKKSRKKDLENKLKEVRFNKVLRKALFNLILYNNVFLEIVKKGETLSDLNVLETTLMRIRALDNGDLVEYYQDLGRKAGNPTWNPELITHIKLDEITNNLWSDDVIKTLWDTVLLKDSIRQWMLWFVQTNQMRGLISVKNSSSIKVKDFISNYKKAEKDKSYPHLIEGEVAYQLMNSFDEHQTLMTVLEWCDEQILEVLQTPPIAVGKPDASGRSNSVEQNNALNTRIIALQALLQDDVTYDLFPKIGFEKVDFLFGTLDDQANTRILETVQVMKNSMFTDEAIIEFLEEQGLIFSTTKVFKDPVEEAQAMAEVQMGVDNNKLSNKDVGTGNEGSIGNKSADSAPSRQRQSSGSISKANQTSMVKNAINSNEDVKTKIKQAYLNGLDYVEKSLGMNFLMDSKDLTLIQNAVIDKVNTSEELVLNSDNAFDIQANTTKVNSIISNGLNVAYNKAVLHGATSSELSLRKQWVNPTKACCNDCKELDGKSEDLHKPFIKDDKSVLIPPFHDNCECRITLINKEIKKNSSKKKFNIKMIDNDNIEVFQDEA
jgi:hypothetical protein